MCGIAGFFKGPTLNAEKQRSLLQKMSATIHHRGPDSSGEWTDPDAHIALAHRRLSILDLSPAGHQPMISPSGRYVITYNGEVYNHLELRKEIDSINWRGHSDTETLLAGFDTWGICATIKKTVGMFAMAVWDRELRELFLVRDRMGEKPLYYGWQGNTFLFGSELKPFREHPDFRNEIDRDSLTLYLRHGYINAPYSIYKGIKKLLPGTVLTLGSDCKVSEYPEPVSYWSVYDAVLEGRKNPFQGTEKEAVDELERVISQAVKGQMISDVPLGAFLSGGTDSSAIVALMQAQSSSPVKTFSIGFHEKGYDEAVYAKEVARHLGTEHTELYVTPKQAMDVIPMLPELYDEPFGDSSAIPTFLVSRLAKKQVSVSLSGDGGDELFGGYGRYESAEKFWSKISKVPYPLRQMTGSALDTAYDMFSGRYISGLKKVKSLSEYLKCKGEREYYHAAVSSWRNPDEIVIKGVEPLTPLTERGTEMSFASYTERMMFTDMLCYLPGDILTKVDRAAMGVSLETRVPLLDHRVVELSWRLPFRYKVQNGISKWALKEVLYRHVPRSIMERPKMGFGVPVDFWIKNEFRDWTDNLLSEKRLREDGFFKPEYIRRRWREHLGGRQNWKESLWFVICFQAWKDRADV
jgi:asparagine synthase (glutamine-hydrolysing)